MKKRLPAFIVTFFITAFIIAAASLATTYAILSHNLAQRIAGQSRASTLIAEQIKSANLNSILAFTDQYFIFILHQRDGRLLFESAKRSGDELVMWEQNKDFIFKELFAKRNGELTYPAREAWQLLAPLKNIVYLYLPDLDWIVATELPAAVSLNELLGFYAPWFWGALAAFSLALSWYLAVYLRRPKIEPFSQPFSPPSTKPLEKEKTHAVYTQEYTQRLVSVAQKALENEKAPSAPATPTPVAPVLSKVEPVMTAEAQASKETTQEKIMEEIEIKDHIKGASEKVKKEEAAAADKAAANEDPAAIDETKKAAEIYFERMMSGKKGKKEKPKPASIIGMALSKKKNREDFGG